MHTDVKMNENENEKWGCKNIKTDSPDSFHVVQFAAILGDLNYF